MILRSYVCLWIRDLEHHLAEHGFHVGLLGSTLINGEGEDIDIIILPHKESYYSHAMVVEALERFGMVRKHKVDAVHKSWRRKGSNDTKMVEIWDHNGLKVDVFTPWSDLLDPDGPRP